MSTQYEAACEIREAINELRHVLQAFAEGDAVLNVSVALSDHAAILSPTGAIAAHANAFVNLPFEHGDLVECVASDTPAVTEGAWYCVCAIGRDPGTQQQIALQLVGSSALFGVDRFKLRVRPCRPQPGPNGPPEF